MPVNSYQLECLVCNYLSDLGHQVEMKAEPTVYVQKWVSRTLLDLRGILPSRIIVNRVDGIGFCEDIPLEDRYIRLLCSVPTLV